MTSSEPGAATPTPELVDRLFRAEAGRLVASLTRRLGSTRLSLAEDVVQEALVAALQQWPFTGIPRHPSAWLRRVAVNRAVDVLRRARRFDAQASRIAGLLEDDLRGARPRVVSHSALADDELRLVLLCCHPSLSRAASAALSLKVACGFGVREIARALLSDERAVAQRLVRAKRALRAQGVPFVSPSRRELASRVDAALDVVYLLFNEAYVAHDGSSLTRDDLSRESLRLARLIADSPAISSPRGDALVALIAFHAARRPARLDGKGRLVRLEDQDRAQWDHALIALAFKHFERAMRGEVETSFHVQAAIAAAHAAATSAADTNWRSILQLYDRLVELEPTPIVRLNRVVAVARARGPAEGLEALLALGRYASLRRYHLRHALHGELLAQLGRTAEAGRAYSAALDCACSAPERRFIESRCRQLRRLR